MNLTPLQKLPNNISNLCKLIVATGIEWLPKVQKITQSGHTANKILDDQLKCYPALGLPPLDKNTSAICCHPLAAHHHQ